MDTTSRSDDRDRPADLESLRQALGDRLVTADVLFGQPTAVVDRTSIVEAARFLRDERSYQLLRSVTAVDLYPSAPRFQVVYHFLGLPAHLLHGRADPRPGVGVRQMRLKVPLPAEDPVLPSVTGIFPTAAWHEREVWDMFGLDFVGHPGLRRILMPEGFEGHPLRKDFPLSYERVAFTSNYDEVRGQKPRARN